MIRDQAILVRQDGSVMFDSPAPKARRGVESRDAWLSRTVTKAVNQQALRGEELAVGERIAQEERPDPKVRDAIRISPLSGKLTVDLLAAKLLLRDRWESESHVLQAKLERKAAQADWFDLGAGIESPRVLYWEGQLAQVVSESKRVMDDLRLAKGVEDLIAIEPNWPVVR